MPVLMIFLRFFIFVKYTASSLLCTNEHIYYVKLLTRLSVRLHKYRKDYDFELNYHATYVRIGSRFWIFSALTNTCSNNLEMWTPSHRGIASVLISQWWWWWRNVKIRGVRSQIISVVISSGERPIVCKHSHQTATVVYTLDNTWKNVWTATITLTYAKALGVGVNMVNSLISTIGVFLR